MADRAAWWLAAACALSAAGAARGLDATWPGCSTTKGSTTMTVVQPGHTNTKVTGIHFVNCNFTTVDLDSFKSYPNVEDINLKDIKATSVTAPTFDNFTNLELLAMRNTQISGNNLPSGLFRNCHKLDYINLSENDMSEAPTALLRGLNLLRVLWLSFCHLRAVPPFFTSQVLPNLDYLGLADNRISQLNDPDTFANAVKLTVLILTRNEIDYIHPSVLKPLTKLTQIFLSQNRLRYISEPLFQHKASLTHIDLINNLIEYIPINAFLGTNLKTLKLTTNRLTHLPGNFFLNLVNTGVHLEEFEFYKNPWDCRCLNKILINVKQLHIKHNMTYDGRREACVFNNQPSLIIDHCA